jgi:hypothetical protein
VTPSSLPAKRHFARSLAAWLCRHAAILGTIVLGLYTFGVIVAQQASHAYPYRGPVPLEDNRPKQLELGRYYEIGTTQATKMLGHGWYGREGSGGRWSAGLSSVIALPAPADPDQVLSLSLRLTAANDRQNPINRTRILLNGTRLATLDVAVDEAHDYIVPIPPAAHQGLPMLLVLTYSHVMQPSARDPREIAVRLEGLRVGVDP